MQHWNGKQNSPVCAWRWPQPPPHKQDSAFTRNKCFWGLLVKKIKKSIIPSQLQTLVEFSQLSCPRHTPLLKRHLTEITHLSPKRPFQLFKGTSASQCSFHPSKPCPAPQNRGVPEQALSRERVNMFALNKPDWSQAGLSWRESLYQERLWGKETLKRLSGRVWSWWGVVLFQSRVGKASVAPVEGQILVLPAPH